MIGFFRNIRRKLTEQEHVRKYIWYTLGEILLVMVGILLALQVNNWNEERKIDKEREAILETLNIEFSENLVVLKVSLKRLDSLKTGLAELLALMRDRPDTLSTQEFEILLERTFFTPTYSPSSFVLEELKNSGGLTRLNDQALELLLFDWERHNANLKLYEESFLKYGYQYIAFLTEFGSVRNLDVISGNIQTLKKSTITENSLDLLSNAIFENTAENFYFLAHLVFDDYLVTVNKAEKIIQLASK